MPAPPFKPPEPGDLVGDYHVEEKLGDGGFGFVYKVERAGRYFALKVIRARELERWGQREINILRHVVHDNVVRFRACDRWPDPEHGYLCFVMDLVVGRTLDEWALDENPTARQVVRVLLEVALALAEILKQGVLHRDLKRENILIRDSDGRPVLVDFGIGWLAGEPTITGERTPPGTDEYRAPEYVRFERDTSKKKAGYGPDVGDELWALGVTFYWLLTDVLPFGHRTEGGLYDRILTHTPTAPDVLNPRVPPALGALCMRLLEKDRGARFADYVELCGALSAALAAAEGDARWDLPLMDPDAPDATPTVKVPGMGPPAGEEQAGLAWKAARPQRGRKTAQMLRPESESDGTPAVAAPAPAKGTEALAQAMVAGTPAMPAEALVALLAEVAPERAWEALPPPVPDSTPSPSASAVVLPAAAPPRAARTVPLASAASARGPLRRALSHVLSTSIGRFPVRAVKSLRPAALSVVVLGAVALVSAGAWIVHTRLAPGTSPATPQPVRSDPSPAGLLGLSPTHQARDVREVAGSQESSEAWAGAAHDLALTPAPIFATMLRKEDSLLKPEEMPAPMHRRKGLRARAVEKCVGAACCAVLGGCTGAPVRPTPKPEACPPGSVQSMKEKLHIDVGDDAAGNFPSPRGAMPVPVRESTQFRLLEDLGKLEGGTILSGHLHFTEKRVIGRFTQARTPYAVTHSVCLEVVAERMDTGESMDSAVVGSLQYVRAVDHFE